MLVTTKGRYALQVMIDLAENYNGKCIPVKDIAKRQELSIKYLEHILPVLSKNRLISGVHGKGGGYRLNRTPENYKVGEILRAAEGGLDPFDTANRFPAEMKDGGKTAKMWSDFYKLTNDYFDSITVADLIKEKRPCEYVI
ncbi:MAG: RrF2 family transcriptional regulator [Oscillospiraceae bacterium]